jgi:hypothetical protein
MAATIFDLFKPLDLEPNFRPACFAGRFRQTHAWVLGSEGPQRQALTNSSVIQAPPCRILFGDLGRLLAAAADEYRSVPMGDIDMEFAYHNLPFAGIVSHRSHAGVPAGFFGVSDREELGVVIRQGDLAWAYVNPLTVRRILGVHAV